MEYFWQPLVAESLAIIATALLLGVAMLGLSLFIEWRNRRPHPPACPRCRYNMNALSQLDCPECGHTVGAVEDWTRRPGRIAPRVIQFLALPILLYATAMLCFAAAFAVHCFHVNSLAGRATVYFGLTPGPVYPDWFSLNIPGTQVSLLAATPMPWNQRVWSVKFESNPPTDDDLRHLASFNDSVGHIEIKDGSLLTDAGLATFQSAPGLYRLSLDSIRLDDVAMQSLAHVPHLGELVLGNAHIKGNALSKLASAKELSFLSISSAALEGDDALKGLALCPSLENIQFFNCKVTPAALTKLDGSLALTGLMLGGNMIKDEHIKALAAMKNLRLNSLDLPYANVTDACVDSLGSIPTLTWVRLAETHITDEGLQKLAGYSKIREILVSQSNCSQAVVDAINKVTYGRVILQN